MPIDPSIPLSVRPFQMPNVLGDIQQAQQIRTQREAADSLIAERTAQTERDKQATEAAKRAQAESDALSALFSSGQPVAPPDIYRIVGPKRGADILKGMLDLQTANIKSDDDVRASLTRRVAAIAALPESMRADAYKRAGDDYVQRGLMKPEDIPAYSPEVLQHYVTSLLSPDKQYEITHPKPMSVGAGTSLVDPQTGKPIYTAPERPSFQSKDVLLNGQRATVNYDPHTGKYTDAGGQDVSASVKPIPPASLILNDQRKVGSTMPDFALTDARPVGPDANKPDATIRMTPNGLHQAALAYIASGQYPPTGRGTDAISVAQREAINSKVGAIAAASGMDVPTLRAFYKSNGASLAQTQKSADAVQAFMATADKNADLLRESMKGIPDTGVPLFNQPLRAFATKVSGDPKMAKMATYLQSVQNEYGRIVAQPNLSGQLTDSARHEAATLLNPNATVAQMLASVEALQSEGSNRLISLGEQIQRIQQRMLVGPGQQHQTAPGGPPAAGGVETWERDPKTGKLVKKGGA